MCVKKTIIKTSTNNKLQGGRREKGPLVHCQWECKWVQPLQKTVWKFFKKLKRTTTVVIQLLSRVELFVTPRTPQAHQAFLSFTLSLSLFKLKSIESVMLSNHLILRHPLLLPSIFLSIRVFSNEFALHIRWPEYWSFSFNISPSNEYSGLISFWIDRFDLLSFQGTLKSLLQITIQKHQFFNIQPSTWSNSHIHT